MTTFDAVDFANERPHPADLVKAGVKAVLRYLSPNTTGNPHKALTRAEMNAYLDAGLHVVCLWETTADDWRGGHDAGVKAAAHAHDALVALGLDPHSTVVYYAVDTDVTAAQLAKTIGPYFGGIGAESQAKRIGVYGGYATVSYLMGGGFVEYGFQTYAWSGGRWYPHAQLRQVHNGVEVAGVVVDLDQVEAADYGAIAAVAAKPGPAGPPSQSGPPPGSRFVTATEFHEPHPSPLSTLSGIVGYLAGKGYHTSVSALQQLNHLGTSTVIHPGQRIYY